MKSILPLVAAIGIAIHCGAADAESLLRKPAGWFATAEAREAGRHILSWQTPNGDWPKNVDTVSRARAGESKEKGTFDNGATTGELRALAKIYERTKEERFGSAFQKGLQLILDAQYPNGGWPQSFPPGEGYARHITFNDDTFLKLARLVRDVAAGEGFEFVPEETRKAAGDAFERAVGCVIKTQVRVNGELAVWCAQHDAETLEPRPARTYELVSLSGAESAGLLLFLMELKDPGPEVRAAVHAGVRWFERAKIVGMRQVRENGERRLDPDPNARPLWARFYEIGTNRPIFSGRDGVKKYSLDEIEAERRNGYAWYGNWGEAVLNRHEAWK